MGGRRVNVEALVRFREAMKGEEGGDKRSKTTHNNVMGDTSTQGNARAYSLARVQRACDPAMLTTMEKQSGARSTKGGPVLRGSKRELRKDAPPTLAERRMGELLRETPRAIGGRPPQKTCSHREQVNSTLEELGITRHESAKAQTLAALPVEIFEAVRDGKKRFNEVRRELKRAVTPSKPPILCIASSGDR